MIQTQQIFRRHINIGRHGTFLIATSWRNEYRSFEPRLLQQIKYLKAVSELCGHRKTLKEQEPLLVVALNDQHVDIQLPSTYRANRSDGYFILVYFFIPTNYTLCKNCFNKCILWAIFTSVNEHSDVILQVIMSDEAHVELPGWWTNKTGLELIQMNCMCIHFTVREEQCGLGY